MLTGGPPRPQSNVHAAMFAACKQPYQAQLPPRLCDDGGCGHVHSMGS